MRQRLIELRSLLNEAAHAYYVLDTPQMEDAIYDRLYRELLDLEEGAALPMVCELKIDGNAQALILEIFSKIVLHKSFNNIPFKVR